MTAIAAAVDAVGLVKRFGQPRAVDGIDLQVGQGEIFGVLGPNGAGKTTRGGRAGAGRSQAA